ncbi:MAG: O-acetylhomoserine aminocarboxypropyltransferase/cysteine synthase [Armatimonadetes bacterium]|nr:O-acetylhomoserine aminocarboxypropyltransferase/cysteine synthase [Armatimonadota bacterium]
MIGYGKHYLLYRLFYVYRQPTGEARGEGGIVNIETLALHAGYAPDPSTGATVAPIHQTTAYAYATAEEIAAVFAGRAPGFIYSRIANPTAAALERRLAELEAGVGCLSCASGMAAIATTALGLTRTGDHVIAARGIFGGTVSFFAKTLARFGVRTTFVDAGSVDAFRAAIEPATRFVFVETITNPRMEVPDLPALAAVTRAAGIPLVVDSTVTTPMLLRPKEWGADLVVHSLSKFINGHGNAIGGAIVDTGNFDWRRGPFEDIGALARRAGKLAFLAHLRTLIYRDLGCCPSPLNSFLHLTGIEGLPLRMEAHCRNAQALAEWLSAHPKVDWVNYPGLPDNPCHEVAGRLFGGRYGGLLTFGLGSAAAAARFVDATRLARNLANLGDSRTLVIHPASTIFQEFSPDERAAAGVPDDLVRVSVGVENIEDIVHDFETALAGV